MIRLASYPEVKAGVSMHPSHPAVARFNGEDERALLEAAKESKQLFMPTKQDAKSVKEDGLGREVLGDNLTVLAFPEMSHGFTTRGDLGNANVRRDVNRALFAAVEFFQQHL